MKALGKAKAEPGITLLDWPEPECGPNDVIIRVRQTAICGTDLHIRQWDEWARKTIPVPMPVGHEFFGIVEKVGWEVRGLKPGDRVSGEGHITCGHCRNCRAGRRHLCRNTEGVGVNRPGAFAERLSLPSVNVFPVPDGIPDEVACILDPLGNAVHTALSFDLVGEDVLITGAGPIGLMAAAVARHVGARNVAVTDVNPYRLALAERMGAKAVAAGPGALDRAMGELRMQEGFDVGLEMSGNAGAFRDMVGHMNHGGKLALLGILPADASIDWGQVIFKGLILKGIYGREMFETWYKMTAMLQSGLSVAPVITHRFPMEEFEKAFETAGSGQAGKVILSWPP
ncbi:MAG: L-threonine 3-dehydrogenase [Fibrobacteres bacterium]|jgi:threonine 3-dehydrogenase|nr:L-threonine 3-dehydrogenase [Fibrobacterota bacterium]